MLLRHYIFDILITYIFFSNFIKKIMSDIIREGQLRERWDLQNSLYRYQGIFLLKKIHGVHSYFDNIFKNHFKLPITLLFFLNYISTSPIETSRVAYIGTKASFYIKKIMAFILVLTIFSKNILISQLNIFTLLLIWGHSHIT